MATLSRRFYQPLGPLEIEVKAMEVWVSFAWDGGLKDVVFECDSKTVADTLLGWYTPLVVVSNILARVALKLLDFRSIKVSHVKHQGNIPAHILAKYVNDVDNCDNYVMWIEENPSLIELAITHDVLNLSSS